MTQTFEREMTISHRDFFRILPKAVGTHRFKQKGNIITVSLEEGEICIILSEERTRKIASLVLPVTDVTFQIKDVEEKIKNNFFKDFDKSYHKGGG